MFDAIEEEREISTIIPITRRDVTSEHPCFQIPKKGGRELRKVVVCSDLNGCLMKRRFKMEDHRVVKMNVVRGMWAASIDISKAYLQVPVDPEATPYLAFNYAGSTWAYTAIPFVLSSAPRTFTLLMCVMAIRQKRKITATHFIDDLLFLHENK
jgi:hypothetical protein